MVRKMAEIVVAGLLFLALPVLITIGAIGISHVGRCEESATVGPIQPPITDPVQNTCMSGSRIEVQQLDGGVVAVICRCPGKP